MKLLPKFTNNPFGLFPKIFIALVITMSFFVAVTAGIVYNISKKSLENEVNLSNLDILRQTRTAIDSLLESTERISLQVSTNQLIQQYWKQSLDITKYNDFNTIKSAVNVSETLVEGAQHVEKICIYSFLNNAQIWSGGSDVYKEMDENYKRILENLLKNSGDSFWIEPENEILFGEKSYSIQYIKFIFGHDGNPQGYILVRLKNDEFIKLLHNIYIRKSGFITVLNNSGKEILDRKNVIEDKKSLVPDIKQMNGSEGVKKIDSGYDNLLVSYTTSSFNGWRYVAVLPSDELDNKAKVILNTVIIVCLILIASAVLISRILTKGIYNPISMIGDVLAGKKPEQKKLDKLIHRHDELGFINGEVNRIICQLGREQGIKDSMTKENTHLKHQLDDNISKLKDYLLYRIICGDISDKEEIIAQADFLDITYAANYFVLVVHFDKNFEQVMKECSEENKSAIKNGALNILENTIVKVAKPVKLFYEAGDRNDKIIGVICANSSDLMEFSFESIKVMCNFYQNLLLNNFGFTATIAIGGVYNGVEDIRKSFEDASLVLKYKFILGSNSVIVKDDIDDYMKKPQQYYYRKHLKNCLKIRNINEIEKILWGISNSLRKDGSLEPQGIYYLKDVLNVLLEYLGEINYMDQKPIEELNKAFINFENKFEDIEDSIKWTSTFIKELFLNLNEENIPNLSKHVEETLKIIENEYAKDLSLSGIAERITISEWHLSKIFKEETGRNFKEYLTEYKMEKAKELLRTTMLPIQNIAERVGYNNKQFSRTFKQYEGITANEYRMSSKD